jgi:hypothetical protein
MFTPLDIALFIVIAVLVIYILLQHVTAFKTAVTTVLADAKTDIAVLQKDLEAVKTSTLNELTSIKGKLSSSAPQAAPVAAPVVPATPVPVAAPVSAGDTVAPIAQAAPVTPPAPTAVVPAAVVPAAQ